MTMQGLELARRYYQECAAPLIEARFGSRAKRIAVGLVGPGSECLGFDDMLSVDHDFGPGFCLWLTDDDDAAFGAQLRELYRALPQEFAGYRRNTTPEGADRVGVMRIRQFYTAYTGGGDVPADEPAWLRIPEHFLATATSGAVFRDDLGEFSRIRAGLLPCYPEDVRMKKLAARLFTMAQAGQYNYPRMEKRGDLAACCLALGEFLNAALSALHLLNSRYTPYYKWAYRSACGLPQLADVARALGRLLEADPLQRTGEIERICARVADTLRARGLSSAQDNFLVVHAKEVQQRIHSNWLRSLDIMVG